MHVDDLTSLQRDALLAAYHAPGYALTRTRGGWWTGQRADGSVASFTTRMVFALGRAWLFDTLEPFAPTAPLTTQGRALAQALLTRTAQDRIA